jgi:ribosome-associated protein
MLTAQQISNILSKETRLYTSRSGGKGGQNVNKVETKVEIEFNVSESQELTASQKETILQKYRGLINDQVIKLVADRHRTQLRNRDEARKKLIALLEKLLIPVKKRRATKPGKAAKEKKLQDKKFRSDKKMLRQKLR